MPKPKKRFEKRKLLDKVYISLERRKTRLMIFIIFWGIIFALLTKTFVFSLEVVRGQSMHPAFQEGGFHIVNKFIYNFTEPEKGHVVIIRNTQLKKDQLIKRVIAVPGDVIGIKRGNVYLDGKLLDEPYVKGKTFPGMRSFKMKENTYFVMGDNREVSYDSRHFGFIEKNEIKGKLAPDKLFILK